jgi:hypothetical protein
VKTKQEVIAPAIHIGTERHLPPTLTAADAFEPITQAGEDGHVREEKRESGELALEVTGGTTSGNILLLIHAPEDCFRIDLSAALFALLLFAVVLCKIVVSLHRTREKERPSAEPNTDRFRRR